MNHLLVVVCGMLGSVVWWFERAVIGNNRYVILVFDPHFCAPDPLQSIQIHTGILATIIGQQFVDFRKPCISTTPSLIWAMARFDIQLLFV